MSYGGTTPFEVREVHARADGLELIFTAPFDPVSVGEADRWNVAQFGCKFHAAYGSPEIDHEGKENSSTAITVSGVELAPDHRRATLKLAGWKAGFVTSVRGAGAKSAEGAVLRNETFY